MLWRRRRAVHAGEVTWGPWRYDARTELLSLEDGADLFDVDVGQSLPVRTTAEELARAADKGWMDTETLGWLVRAMNELGRLRDHGEQP